MQQKKLWPIVVTLIGAVGSFMLSRVIWPDLAGAPAPTAGQLPFLIGVGVVESLAFGIGLSFLVFGWSLMKGRSKADWLVFFSAAWPLVSWWPHDNLHRTTEHGDYGRLLGIEYGFHVTLIIAGVIIASFLWRLWSMWQNGQE